MGKKHKKKKTTSGGKQSSLKKNTKKFEKFMKEWIENQEMIKFP